MKSDGKVSFDQGIVVNNEDPKKLGRVQVRMLSDGIDTPDTMHKGDDELHWYEPCILGAGYEVGSLTIPPVGSFLWCLECKFNTENVFRIYLGSAYGSGPENSKNFNAMLTPPEVIETPSEALISYPYSQLLYKATTGSYIKFYGDDLAGFNLCTGIPIRDKDGNYTSQDHYTYNSVYGDREELWFSISEMPDPIDKDNPEEPSEIPISYIQMNSEKIFSGVVRDRFGDTFNHQLINPTGIFMKVRGMGDVTSPSENKELEDNLTETVDKADTIVEKAAEKATKEVTKENGPLEKATKEVQKTVEQKTTEATQASYKLDSKETGKSKKEMSLLQERLKMLAIRVPGGYGFIQSAMANAVKGNMKALLHHILGAVANIAFSLAAGLVRDTFNSLLSNPNIVNKEQASKFVKRVIGEANLGSLVGKASTMIATIGGKLGPFGQLFQRVANHILGVVTSKIGFINRINNKMGSMAEILMMIDELKPTMNTLIAQGIQSSTVSSGNTVIAAINQSIIQGKPVELSKITDFAKQELASQLGVDASAFTFGSKTNTTPDAQANPTNSSNEMPFADVPLPEPVSQTAENVNSSPNNTNTQTNNNPEAKADSAQKLSPTEEQDIREVAEIINNASKESLEESLVSVTSTLISKTLSYTTKETTQTAESSEELENELNLDAVGATAIVRGETYDCCAHLDNDGAQVHVGEECLFQMTPSNIMQFVSDPDYINQTSRIIASDGIDDTTNSSSFNHTMKSSASLLRHVMDNGITNSSRLYTELGLGCSDEETGTLGSILQLVTAEGETPKSQATFSQNIANDNPSSTLLVEGNQGSKSSTISLEKDKIELKVGKAGSSLTMTESQIELRVGASHILIKEGEISIGALNVNIGAGVTLAYMPTGIPEGDYTCYFDAKQVESRNPINWKIDETINFN